MIVHETRFSVVDSLEEQILGVAVAVVEAECKWLDNSILEIYEGRTHWWYLAGRWRWIWQIAMRGLLKLSD